MAYTVQLFHTSQGPMDTQEQKSRRMVSTDYYQKAKKTFPSFPESYSTSVGHKYKGNIFALITNLTAVGFFLKVIRFWNTASRHSFKSYFPQTRSQV